MFWKCAKIAGVILSAVLILLIVCIYSLIKDVPSIDDHPSSHCEGGITEPYLAYDRLPKETLQLLQFAERGYKNAIAKGLSAKAKKPGERLAFVFRQIIVHVWLDQLDNEELLAYYANTAYFGQGCYGVGAAARAYFKKDVSALSLEQNAELVVMPRSPERYSLATHPEANRQRAVQLLEEVRARGGIPPSPESFLDELWSRIAR